MKNYLVIGGSSGIGQATVELLAQQGHQVYATYRSTAPNMDLPTVHYHPLDVLSESSDHSFIPDALDGLVYCPGSIQLLPFGRIAPQDFEKDFSLQVTGAIKVIQAVLPQLRQSGEGSVVLFSTVAVQTGFNFHSQVAASKGAIEGLTRSIAAEFAPWIRFNAIAPSITGTPLASRFLSSEEKVKANAERHPLKRIGHPDDMAQAVLYLLSDSANWITGQVLPVDGGISSIRG